MIAFELAAAIVAMAAAPQHAEPSRSTSSVRVSDRANTRTAPASTNARHAVQTKKTVQSKKTVSPCRRSNASYDAKSNTYRDARGKRQRCAR